MIPLVGIFIYICSYIFEINITWDILKVIFNIEGHMFKDALACIFNKESDGCASKINFLNIM